MYDLDTYCLCLLTKRIHLLKGYNILEQFTLKTEIKSGLLLHDIFATRRLSNRLALNLIFFFVTILDYKAYLPVLV